MGSSCLRCKRGGSTPSSSLYTVNDSPWSKDQFHDCRKDSSPNWRSSFLSNQFFNQTTNNSSLTFRWVQPAWQVSNFTARPVTSSGHMTAATPGQRSLRVWSSDTSLVMWAHTDEIMEPEHLRSVPEGRLSWPADPIPAGIHR